MPVPHDVVDPPFNIMRCSHVVLDVTDLGINRAFYQEVIGLHFEDVDDSAVYFRGSDESQHHSLVLRRAAMPGCARIAFKVADEGDLDKAAAFCADNKLPHAFAEQAFQGRTLVLTDPFGVRIGLYAMIEQRPSHPHRDDRAGGGHPQSFAHFNIVVPEVQDSVDFYARLGFRPAEYAEDDRGNGRLAAAWMQRKDTAYDIAFISGSGPRLHHFAYRMPAAADILRLCEDMKAGGWQRHIERGPDSRDAASPLVVYVRDPDGHRLKLYAGGADNRGTARPPLRRLLGAPHPSPAQVTAAPRSWYEDATPFAGQAVREPQFAADITFTD